MKVLYHTTRCRLFLGRDEEIGDDGMNMLGHSEINRP